MKAHHAIGATLALAACAVSPASPDQDAAHPLLTTPPASCGRYACAGPFYRSEELEFGAHLVGAALTPPANSRVDGDCRDECTFSGADGVSYFLVRGRLRDMSISVAHASRLPFGLSGDETPAEALVAMQRVTSIPMEISGREDGDHVVTVQGALKNALGEAEAFNLVFLPEGQLYFIEMLGAR